MVASPSMAPRLLRTGLACLALLSALPAHAWIWPEHRDIAAEALRELPAAQKKTIDQMWVGVRAIGGKQVCANVVDPGAEPTGVPRGEWDKVCVDFAAFPALAGDHSCTAAELWSDAAKEPWAVKVVWVAAKTKERLASSKDEAQRTDFLSLSHLAMQYVDPRYLTRAEGNNAHFLFPRAPVAAKEDLDKYLDRVLSPGIEINATGLYAQYHMLALRYAALYHAAPEAEKAELGARALLAEGVALHFLEDSFSAGHYAATWGGAAWQKGTHDLYSTIGLTTMTWKGDLFASHGDGHMSEQDMKVAAATVRQSLDQVATAAEGRMPLSAEPLSASEKKIVAFNFCKEEYLPPTPDQPVARSATKMVLLGTPVPAGGKDEIHPPRSRAEIGPFVGAVSGYSLGLALGGYDSWNNARVRSEFENRRPGRHRARGGHHEQHGRADLAAGRAGDGPRPARPGMHHLHPVPPGLIGQAERSGGAAGGFALGAEALPADALLRASLRPHRARPGAHVHLAAGAHRGGLRGRRWRAPSRPAQVGDRHRELPVHGGT